MSIKSNVFKTSGQQNLILNSHNPENLNKLKQAILKILS